MLSCNYTDLQVWDDIDILKVVSHIAVNSACQNSTKYAKLHQYIKKILALSVAVEFLWLRMLGKGSS